MPPSPLNPEPRTLNPHDGFHLRAMRPDEWPVVAELICKSIRVWYDAVGRPGRFPGGPSSCMVFPENYEDLDPGCCVVAEDVTSGRLAGSCFYHPRDLHISLGIMNTHPDYFGRGVAGQMLRFICDLADRQRKPIRLFSSAMNVDSFSLYTRAGFVPRDIFQVMSVAVPEGGLKRDCPDLPRVRPATSDDVPAMVALEWEVSGIRRENDYRCFIANRRGCWRALVIESASGPSAIDGFLVSIRHPGSNMIGPGVMRDPASAAALVLAQLDHFRGLSPALLVPATCTPLVRQLYAWGLRNTELSLFQCRGQAQPFRGVALASFMPETG